MWELLNCSLFFFIFFWFIYSKHKPLYCACVIQYFRTLSCCFPLSLSHALSLQSLHVVMLQNAGSMPFSWLPCQPSAYGVIDRVTDFSHTHLIFCLQRLVADASIVISHIWAKANVVSAAAVCVFLLCEHLFSWSPGSKRLTTHELLSPMSHRLGKREN